MSDAPRYGVPGTAGPTPDPEVGTPEAAERRYDPAGSSGTSAAPTPDPVTGATGTAGGTYGTAVGSAAPAASGSDAGDSYGAAGNTGDSSYRPSVNPGGDSSGSTTGGTGGDTYGSTGTSSTTTYDTTSGESYGSTGGTAYDTSGSTGGDSSGGSDGAAATARQRGAEVAGTAKEEAGNLAQTAREEGRHLAEQAKTEIRNVTEDARTQLREQAAAQTEKVTDSLRRFGDQVGALAEGRPEDAGPLASYAESAAQELRHVASRVQDGGFEGVLDDTRRFARERPALFLGVALVAGFAAGRLLRGGKEVHKQHQDGGDAGQGSEHWNDTGRQAGAYRSEQPVQGYGSDTTGTAQPLEGFGTGATGATDGEASWR